MRAIRSLVVSVLLFACNEHAQRAVDAAAATASASSTVPPPTTPTASVANVQMPANAAHLAQNGNAFAFDLWHAVAKGGDNLAMSPASISAALLMAAGGASGDTAKQMNKVLHATEEDAQGWGALLQAMQSPSRPLVLRVANRLFGEKSFHFVPAFLDVTKSRFGAALEPVDFAGATEAARVGINAWVEGQTEHKIKDLIPPGVINESTKLVLVNAIYFLAEWQSPFEKRGTSDQVFHVSATSSKNVATMHQTYRLPWMQADGVSMIEMPYRGDAAMWVVVPDRVDGLADVEKGLSATKLDAWKGALSNELVEVAVPRFEISAAEPLRLRKALVSLGMTLAFDAEKADFSRAALDAKPRLYISDALHKAFVKVDEKGTEAAAATAVLAMGGGAPRPSEPKHFHADHPFLFFIVDKPTGLVSFMGRVANPS